MRRGQLILAGWIAIILAMYSVLDEFLFDALPKLFQNPEEKLSEIIMLIKLAILVICAMVVFILRSFRQLLNFRFNFYDVNFLITIMIWLNIVMAIVLIMFSTPSGVYTNLLKITKGVFIVSIGFIMIVFSIKLLRLSEGLFGMLKPYCYLTIAYGFTSAVLYFYPPILIVSQVRLNDLIGALQSIIEGIIFLRAADEMKS